MFYSNRNILTLIVLLNIFLPADQQFGMYSPYMFPAPVPMPMMAPVLIPVDNSSFEETTTQRPINCPPCPPCLCKPSCTPSFFSYCSPCHQICRCKNPKDAPDPLPAGFSVPLPFVGPSPVILAPIPPAFPVRRRPRKSRRPRRRLSESSRSSDTYFSEELSYSSSLESYNRRRRRRKNRKRYYRSPLRSSKNMSLIEPVLSHKVRNRDDKFHKKLKSNVVGRSLRENIDNRLSDVDNSLSINDRTKRRKKVVAKERSEEYTY